MVTVIRNHITMVDPGFLGGGEPTTGALFSENVFRNKRIGSGWGEGAPGSVNEVVYLYKTDLRCDQVFDPSFNLDKLKAEIPIKLAVTRHAGHSDQWTRSRNIRM